MQHLLFALIGSLLFVVWGLCSPYTLFADEIKPSENNRVLFERYLPKDPANDSICLLNNGSQQVPWFAGSTDTFLNVKDLSFAPMNDQKSLDGVKLKIKDFKGSSPFPSSSTLLTYFDTNTELYNSALNNLFACALIDSKSRIYASIEAGKSSGGFRFANDSQFKKYIDALKEKNGKDLKDYKCRRGASNTSKQATLEDRETTSLRIVNTSSYLTCRYIAYTHYVSKIAEQEGAIIDNPSDINDLVLTQDLLRSRIANAPVLSISTISTTLDSYLAFERAYELHIVLSVIRDGYIIMRKRLDDALSPFSQFIYKAHNITGPGR